MLLVTLPATQAADEAAAAGADSTSQPAPRQAGLQPGGALLLLDQAAEFVRHASTNLDSVLPQAVAGTHPGAGAARLLPAWLHAALRALPVDADRPVLLAPPQTARGAAPGATTEILAHRSADGLVVEFVETRHAHDTADPEGVLRGLPAALDQASANPFRDAHALARAAQALTGCARALVYRFRPDWSGEVVAEARGAELMPFLGLRFPANDVPPRARARFMRNRLRITVDAEAAAVPVLPCDPAPDLGMALLRATSPAHCAYLRAMEVRSSLVASILVDGVLWGLLACHHDVPWLAPHPVRQGLEQLADAFAPAIRRQQVRAAAVAAQQVAVSEARLAALAARPARLLPQLLAGPHNLMRQCTADGIAWTDGDRLVAAGVAPPPGWLRGLLARLGGSGTAAGTLLESTELARAHDEPGLSPAPAAGMLAVALPQGGLLALFRTEFVHEVVWGVDPARQITPDPAGAPPPRASFAQRRESVRGTSRAWTEAERGILLTASRRLAEAHDWPALSDAAWSELMVLGAPCGRATLQLADLLPPTEAIAVTDGSGNQAPTLFVADALLHLLGASPEAFVGQPWRSVAEQLGIAHAFGQDGRVADRGIEAWSPERGLIGLAVVRTPLLQLDAPGVPARTLSLIRLSDETRTSRATAARDAAETKSARLQAGQTTLLRTLGHELKGPLHAMLGLAELIVDIGEDAAADARLYGSEVLGSGRHMMDVIEAMLDLTRIEAGEAAPEIARIDLARCVREACGIAAPRFAERGIRFSPQLPARGVPARGDARMLRQAVVNLLANAARFTPAHGRAGCTLAVRDGWATITVSDSGPGVAAALNARIFEPFFQVNPLPRQRCGGLGLGLFIARTFVGLHGGRIGIAEASGGGALFRIDLPLTPG
jgi:light-regulated signal transduction histidine kinase (bacteriophytochrome)